MDQLIKIVTLEETIDEDNLEAEIEKLVERTQDLLKLEWEGVKEESVKGELSKTQKNILYQKHLSENQ